jgi:hypothetical protein
VPRRQREPDPASWFICILFLLARASQQKEGAYLGMVAHGLPAARADRSA